MSDDESKPNDAQHEQHDFEEVSSLSIDSAYSEANDHVLSFLPRATSRQAPMPPRLTRCSALRFAKTDMS